MSDLFLPPLETRYWPLGPHVMKLSMPAGRQEAYWVAFKLTAAAWYLDTMQLLLDKTGDLDRYMGVEMAIDGLLGSISSAFDAAVAVLIETIEYPLPQKTEDHKYSWKRCVEVASQSSVQLASTSQVNAALAGDNTAIPTGWLAVARRLRNKATHRTTIGRAFTRNVSENLSIGLSRPARIALPDGSVLPVSPTAILLPDGTQVEPVQWGKHLLSRVETLTTSMCDDLAAILTNQGR